MSTNTCFFNLSITDPIFCTMSSVKCFPFSVSLRIQSECGKIRTRKTHNTDTSYAVFKASLRLRMVKKRDKIVIKCFSSNTWCKEICVSSSRGRAELVGVINVIDKIASKEKGLSLRNTV